MLARLLRQAGLCAHLDLCIHNLKDLAQVDPTETHTPKPLQSI